eukprot:5039949-Prymnesium_polylepis.2
MSANAASAITTIKARLGGGGGSPLPLPLGDDADCLPGSCDSTLSKSRGSRAARGTALVFLARTISARLRERLRRAKRSSALARRGPTVSLMLNVPGYTSTR